MASFIGVYVSQSLISIPPGWLVGLSDLNTEKTYVQERIATYFATLLSVGEFSYTTILAQFLSFQVLVDSE